MRLERAIKPIVKVPLRGKNGFYCCPCGNRFVGYNCQAKREACGADLDWDSVDVTEAELEQDKMDRRYGRDRKCHKK